jgi:hypothetical protein
MSILIDVSVNEIASVVTRRIIYQMPRTNSSTGQTLIQQDTPRAEPSGCDKIGQAISMNVRDREIVEVKV